MQDRRYRPGDALDDYCPRERRITDHAIVAMVEEEIQRTRCSSCDAEHEYKEAKVPAPRRKTQPPALFAQVLEGMQGPTPRPQSPPPLLMPVADVSPGLPPATSTPAAEPAPLLVADSAEAHAPPSNECDQDREGGFRRSLIRATFPKLEGAVTAPRALPEFTIQSLNNRGRNSNGGGARHATAGGGGGKFRGRRRPAGGGSQDNLGPMRFREHGSGQGGQGDGRQGQRQGQGPGQGPGQGQGGGRRRRGGKKNR